MLSAGGHRVGVGWVHAGAGFWGTGGCPGGHEDQGYLLCCQQRLLVDARVLLAPLGELLLLLLLAELQETRAGWPWWHHGHGHRHGPDTRDRKSHQGTTAQRDTLHGGTRDGDVDGEVGQGDTGWGDSG